MRNYKYHKPKETTSITWFNCSYCGKYQSRRTSKIKNPSLIFCDNSCRAKYVSKKTNKIFFENKDIQPYLFLFKKEISQISAFVAQKSKVPNIIEDLIKEAPFVIWKCLQNKKSEKIEKPYFCKYYKKHLFSFLRNFEYTEKHNSIDFFESSDKLIELAYYRDYANSLDTVMLINKMVRDMEKLPLSCKLAIDREVFNLELEDLEKKYKLTKRQVVYNCSKGKKILRIKYNEKL